MGVQSTEKEPKQKKKPGRAPTSCAECRRLKLRCDRQVPCEKCVTRGCGAICPDGSLTPGRGGKLVLANTEELHERIDRLCGRIRELEDALRTLHEKDSSSAGPHPLLSSELLQLKGPENFTAPSSSSLSTRTPPQPHPPSQSADSRSPSAITNDDPGEDAFIDAFGTLTVGVHGEYSFLGKTARSEYLMRVSGSPPAHPHSSYTYAMEAPVPAQPPVNLALPRTSKRVLEPLLTDENYDHEELGKELLTQLPPMSEASHLCEVYLEHGKYLYTALPRRDLWDELLAPLYQVREYTAYACQSHLLALVYIIFALGALFDPHREPYSQSAREYYRLARAALDLSSPVNETTLASIQTLIHMAQFLDLSDWESKGSNVAWSYIGHAVRLGHSIGLHINAKRWGLDGDEVNRRSRVFWPLISLDTWSSFSFGRPPSTSLAYVDCAYPQDPDSSANHNGESALSFLTWTWKYTSLLQSVMSAAFGVKHPTYATIIEIDRQIRDFPVPSYLRPHCESDFSASTDHILQMQRWMILSAKEWLLLNLHRSYFAYALDEAPTQLVQHRYYPSVLAIYRSSWRLIHCLESSWKIVPHLLARISLAWSQALSAAIVICLLLTRAPGVMGNPSESLEELDRLVALFEQAAPQCRSADNLLEFVQKLRQKGHEIFGQSRTPQNSSLSPAELDRLGGKTHLISRSSPSPSQPVQHSMEPVTPEAGPSGYSIPTAPSGLHPTLAKDLRGFDPTSTVPSFYDTPAPPAQDVQMNLSDFLGPPQSLAGYGLGYQQPMPQGLSPPAPVLDATWQSFIEQLGF